MNKHRSVQACTKAGMHTCTHAHMHTCAHACTHAHAHTQVCNPCFLFCISGFDCDLVAWLCWIVELTNFSSHFQARFGKPSSPNKF